MAKHKPPLTLADLRAALLHDTRKLHAKEIAKITKAKGVVLDNLAQEFGSSATCRLFERFEEQEDGQ